MKIRQIDFKEALDLMRKKVEVYAISKTSKNKALVIFKNIPLKQVEDYIFLILEEVPENE